MQRDKKPRALRAAAVREADIEPYTALRWVGILFKVGAVFLAVAILAEIVAGISIEGWGALPVLLGELARTIVLAIVLWGGGDLVRLLIHLGHDIRAERILLARIAHRLQPRQQTAAAAPAEARHPGPRDHELALPDHDQRAAAHARELTETDGDELGEVERKGEYGETRERGRRGPERAAAPRRYRRPGRPEAAAPGVEGEESRRRGPDPNGGQGAAD